MPDSSNNNKFLIMSWAQAIIPAALMATSFQWSLSTQLAIVSDRLENMKEAVALYQTKNELIQSELVKLGIAQASQQAQLNIVMDRLKFTQDRMWDEKMIPSGVRK